MYVCVCVCLHTIVTVSVDVPQCQAFLVYSYFTSGLGTGTENDSPERFSALLSKQVVFYKINNSASQTICYCCIHQ